MSVKLRDCLPSPNTVIGRFFLLVRQLEDSFSPLDVCLDGSDRALHDQPDPHRGGQVNDDVASVHQLGQDRDIHDRIDDVVESSVSGRRRVSAAPGRPEGTRRRRPVDFQMLDVLDAPGGQVVDEEDVVARLEESLDKMRADEPCSPRDEKRRRLCGPCRLVPGQGRPNRIRLRHVATSKRSCTQVRMKPIHHSPSSRVMKPSPRWMASSRSPRRECTNNPGPPSWRKRQPPRVRAGKAAGSS